MNINEELTLDNILEKIASMPLRGYRFVTMTTVDCGDTFDIYYHFDRRYKLNNLRLKVAHGAKVPSISGICSAALIVENEIQDLFGITFTGLAIDYQQHFLLADGAPEKPFCRVPGVYVSAEESRRRCKMSMLIPFGPQHPVLPEPLQLRLEINDEQVVSAMPVVGYVTADSKSLPNRRTSSRTPI